MNSITQDTVKHHPTEEIHKIGIYLRQAVYYSPNNCLVKV